MKNAFRAGSSLVGVAAVLLTPAVAAGQIDAGQTVGQAVGQVGDALSQAGPQAPVQGPAAPVQPASPPAPGAAPQAPPSAPAAPAPAPVGAGGSSGASGGGATSGADPSSGGSSGSTRSAGAGKPAGRSAGGGGSGKVRAAGSNKAGGAGTVLAQADTDELDPPQGESYSGAVTTSPDTGVAGDPELPFTGGPVLLLLAMGIVALAAGLALRTAARRRHVG
jgi:hypothetical protein